MSIMALLLLMILELWLTSLILLVAHRTRSRLGLIPLLLLIGGLAGALQFPSLPPLSLEVVGKTATIFPASYLLLPPLLLGLLLIYIGEGTVQARSALVGVLVVTLLAGAFQLITSPTYTSSWLSVQPADPVAGAPLRVLLASSVSLAADLLVLILVYQALNNLRWRFPSRTAAIGALQASLWCDALVFSLIAYSGTPILGTRLLIGLLGKTVAGVIIYPLLVVYLNLMRRNITGVTSNAYRPVFDIFSSTRQLEARASYHYNLLQTLLQVNQLIVRTTDAQALLNETCRLLVLNRDYRLVWAGLTGKQTGLAEMGSDDGYLEAYVLDSEGNIRKDTPGGLALRTGKALIIPSIASHDTQSPWRQAALERGYASVVAYPLAHNGQLFGVLTVYAARPSAFDHTEIDLLQELADDLANALANIDLRRQQASLFAASENLPDALVIVDLEGTITYANPAATQLVNLPLAEMLGRDVYSFTSDSTVETFARYQNILLTQGEVIAEFEIDVPGRGPAILAVRASLVRDLQGQPVQAVIGATDITDRHLHERRLLTLNRLVTELVEIHTKDELLQYILTASEELLSGWAAAIYLVAPHDPHQISESIYHNLPEAYARRIAQGYSGLPGEKVALTRKPAYVQDTLADAEYSQRVLFMAEYGIRSLLVLPVLYQEQLLGALVIYFDQPRSYPESDLQLGMTLAHTLAIAIQNVRLYSQLQSYAAELEERVRLRTGELQAAKERIEAILASVPDAVFVLDEADQLIVANAAGEALMLAASQQALDMFSPQFLERLKQGAIPAEHAVLHARGRVYQALVSPLPMDVQHTGLVIVFRDVTRFHELDQMKTRFVSDVSHELRTPLTNIMLYLDLLSAVDDAQKAPGYLATLQRETKRLGYLIEDLLTISRLEAGRVQLNIKPLEVNRILADLVSDRARLAAEQQLRLSFRPAESLPEAFADPGLLNQAVSNLLTNAISYTPAGGAINVTTAARQEEALTWVTIEIADTGVGIPPDELDAIFDRFYRGSASRQTGAPGTGLGLAIATEIANQIGGKITVDSQVGQGSKFTIWLKAVL